MAGILGGNSRMSQAISLSLRKLRMDEIGCSRISRRSFDGIRRREAKVSDVGGKKTLRLSPIYYTSIAEIKGFRFKLEKTISTPKKSSRE
jgi:hypothetical protein